MAILLSQKVVIKRQSNEIFDLHFFHYSNLSGPLTNGLKYFRFWLRFRGVIQILGSTKLTRRGMKPWGDWQILITQWILNQNRKYFKPLVSGPGRFELWKNWMSKMWLDCLFKWSNAMACKTPCLEEWTVPHDPLYQLQYAWQAAVDTWQYISRSWPHICMIAKYKKESTTKSLCCPTPYKGAATLAAATPPRRLLTNEKALHRRGQAAQKRFLLSSHILGLTAARSPPKTHLCLGYILRAPIVVPDLFLENKFQVSTYNKKTTKLLRLHLLA